MLNQAVTLRISILSSLPGVPPGALEYRETHSDTSNGFGLVNLTIGAGLADTGILSGIDWSAADHYIQVELDPQGGTNYINMGTSQLLTVPYAMHAQTVESGDNLGDHTATQNINLNNHWLSNDGTNKGLRVDSSGYVGIGHVIPFRQFSILGTSTLASMVLSPNEPFSGDDASIIFTEDDDGTYHMEMKYDGGDNRMYWYGKNNSSLNGPHMGINRDNGRVGIGTGTVNPVSELEVVGTITATAFDGGDASGLVNVQADTIRGSMGADTNDILRWNGNVWQPVPEPRVAFHASASADQTVGDTAYDTLRCNNSSSGENFEWPAGCYDNSTYAFEAPVDGIYFFEAAVLWANATLAEVRNAIFIRVNNTDEVGEWSASGGTDFFGTGVSTTLELNAGDEVRIRVYNGDTANSMDTFSQSGKYCYFSGFLVAAQ